MSRLHLPHDEKPEKDHDHPGKDAHQHVAPVELLLLERVLEAGLVPLREHFSINVRKIDGKVFRGCGVAQRRQFRQTRRIADLSLKLRAFEPFLDHVRLDDFYLRTDKQFLELAEADLNLTGSSRAVKRPQCEHDRRGDGDPHEYSFQRVLAGWNLLTGFTLLFPATRHSRTFLTFLLVQNRTLHMIKTATFGSTILRQASLKYIILS